MTPVGNRDILQKIPLFSDLESVELDILAALLKPREYAKEATIVTRDDPGNALYAIVQGQVKVALYGETGREIILSTLKDGDFFGEMALIDGSTRSASVIAQKSSKLLVLERSDFIDQVQKNPKIGLKIMQEMSSRLREADDKIGTLALLDVYGRLARLLIHLAGHEGRELADGSVMIDKRPTHQDLAAMIGTSRETVSRALGDFSKKGIIEMSGKSIRLTAAALSELEGQSSS